MGSFDGAELCKLVVLYLLSKLQDLFGIPSVSLYRDCGLAAVRSQSGRILYKLRKYIIEVFKSEGLSITIQSNHFITDFLDVTMWTCALASIYHTASRVPSHYMYIQNPITHHPPSRTSPAWSKNWYLNYHMRRGIQQSQECLRRSPGIWKRMPNMDNSIKQQNECLLRADDDENPSLCNCTEKAQCPLNDACLTPILIYTADIKFTEQGKISRTSIKSIQDRIQQQSVLIPPWAQRKGHWTCKVDLEASYGR